MLFRVLGRFIDFLYPKDSLTYELESWTPGEMLSKLPPPKDNYGDRSDTTALFSYEDIRVRTLIWELKYRRNPKIVKSLAIILYDVLKTELMERAFSQSDLWRSGVFLIPMPMSNKRFKERGWNQTEILCEMVKRLDTENLLEYNPKILRKTKHTESQTTLKNRRERKENVKDSMSAKGDSLKGALVILVDDVTTTGATFGDARRALREIGVRDTLCVALAH